MRSPELTDTGLDLDVTGTPDELVALVQQAVARSGEAAQTTRHYIAIDGGTSADIRLRVVSVDDPAPLLAFAITTARSARGTAASTFILQHGVQKRRRQRSLLGQEPFLAFLHELASIVTETDPGSSITLRVHGARTVLSQPRTQEEPVASASVEPQAPVPTTTAAPTFAAAPPVVEPPAVPAAPAPTPTAWPAPGHATDSTPAAPTASPTPPSDAPAAAPAVAPPVAEAPVAVPEPATSAPAPAPAPSAVVEPVVPTPQVRSVPTVIAAPPMTTSGSSVAPELQITVPPGLVDNAPRQADSEAADEPSAQRAVPSGAPTRQAEFDATIAAASLRSGDFALELPDGERIHLRRALLIGRNPSSRPEHSDAELRAIVDPRMSVSKTHTAVVPGRRSIRVTDLHSTNGTTITDAAGAVTVCLPGEAYVVESGSTIGIGEYPIRVITV